MVIPGDPAPAFKLASSVNPAFQFDTVAGRYVVLSFFASSALPYPAQFLAQIERRRERFDVVNAVFFGVSIDPQDATRLKQEWPGIMYFWDFEREISRRFGAFEAAPGDTPKEPDSQPASSYSPRTLVLDQALRVIAVVPFGGEAADHVAQVLEILDSLPPADQIQYPAPVLVVPFVFEPELCRELIEYYRALGGEDSGFMRDVDGKTVAIMDYSHKRRQDCEITNSKLIGRCQERLSRRVVPAIRQAFQFQVTRIERHIVACYDAADGGHFRAHRDNTTLGTAHRRFAVTLNLNAEEFDGGELWFPEFGRRRYKAPTGGAVVFSCSLLHEATPVTRGRRYAFLPFLYDDAAAGIRERNRKFLAGGKPVVESAASASSAAARPDHPQGAAGPAGAG